MFALIAFVMFLIGFILVALEEATPHFSWLFAGLALLALHFVADPWPVTFRRRDP